MTNRMEEITLDSAAKKAVLRMFTYGLYAVGVAHGDDRNLFTANWLMQVSFEPPLVSVSVENDSHSIGLLRESGVFAVSVFSTEQRSEAGLLGKRWHLRPTKIEDIRYRLGVTGCPILEGAPGVVECRVISSTSAGDSTLFLAEVISADVQADGMPLTMKEAGYRHAG